MTSRKGTKRELYIAEKFKKEGYITLRKYASIGSYDFIGFRKAQCEGSPFGHCHSEMIAIQVKGTPWELVEESKQQLIKDANEFGARPIWVYREVRKSVLGFYKNGKPRRPEWRTVYLDEPYLDFTKALVMKPYLTSRKIRKVVIKKFTD
jgi:Holliday junction resolvase